MAGTENLAVAGEGMTDVSNVLTAGKTYRLECAQDHLPIELFEIEAANAVAAAAAAAEIAAGRHATISRGLPLYPSTPGSLNSRLYSVAAGVFLFARTGKAGSVLVYVETS